MGGAIFSLHRLRNHFLINLYKQGLVGHTTTLQQLFESKSTVLDEVHVVTKSELKEIFGKESNALLIELYAKCRFPNDCIPVNFIVDFLEHGAFKSSTRESVKKQINNVGIYPEVWKSLELKTLDECCSKSTDLILFEGSSTIANNQMEKDKNMVWNKQEGKKSSECRSIWKKHETVIQERIVKHVTVDEDGNMNELITTDKSQNDIIHVESKITGEFAHREFTQQEQTESMDNEMATFIRATEEYIHLKSADDEYEYLHSDVPTPQPTESYHVGEDPECEPSLGNYEEDEDLMHDTDEVEYS